MGFSAAPRRKNTSFLPYDKEAEPTALMPATFFLILGKKNVAVRKREAVQADAEPYPKKKPL